MSAPEPARVYTVSGGGSGDPNEASLNSSSLPDILRRSGSSNKRKKRKANVENDKILSRIELIQDFEFPQASNKIKSTRDGLNIVATGTYKPQIRVWECEQLSLKFERHTDAENIDFVLLSDDWTKSLHLQSDRSLALHSQGGIHTSVRLPRFGRSLGYHFPSADAVVGAASNEVYRLNLDQGRYLAPFELGSRGNRVTGCNAIDVNPAHGLLSFGTEGEGVVELWDPRMRHQAGSLNIATPQVLDGALLQARRQLPGVYDGDDEDALIEAKRSLSVTALSSAEDGLNMAVGTSTGHVLLFDLRMDRPYTTKDQGFGLPINSLSWPGDRAAAAAGGSASAAQTRSEAQDTVLSSDAKVVKVWDRNSGDNIVSISPAGAMTNINDVHHYPGSGLVFAAVEGTQMCAWYVPALGPAPKWCSFIDSLTDEMDGIDTTGTGGATNAYEDFKFVDDAELERLELSHLVGTPLLRPYMHGYFISLSLYERARLLTHPTAFAEARQKAIQAKLDREAESRVRTAAAKPKVPRSVQVNKPLAEKVATKSDPRTGDSNLLQDSRFKELFTNPEFEVDETSREYALLNPTETIKPRAAPRETERKLVPATEEELESSSESVDPDEEDEESEEDESEESEPHRDPITAPGPSSVRAATIPRGNRAPRLISDGDVDDEHSLGERARAMRTHRPNEPLEADVAGGASHTWTPSAAPKHRAPKKAKNAEETFGMGLSKGAGVDQGYGVEALSEEARFGRTKRRHPNRSASRNAMRNANS